MTDANATTAQDWTKNLNVRFAPEFNREDWDKESASLLEATAVYPYFREYQGQHKPQEVYIYLDSDGGVWVDYDPEIGGAVTMDIYHGRDLRFGPIPSTLTGNQINELLNELGPDLAAVHDGHTIELDSTHSNMEGALTAEAAAACDRINEKIAAYDHSPEFTIWEAEEFYGEEMQLLPIRARTTDEELKAITGAEKFEALSNDIVFSDDVYEFFRTYRDELREKGE